MFSCNLPSARRWNDKGTEQVKSQHRKIALDKECSEMNSQTPSTGLRHPSSLEEGAGKRCSECDELVVSARLLQPVPGETEV